MFLVVCAISVQAQTHLSPIVSGTISKPIYTTSYEIFKSSHVQLEFSHPYYLGWEVWMSNEGIVYVVLQRKQTWFDRLTTYAISDATILNIGCVPTDLYLALVSK